MFKLTSKIRMESYFILIQIRFLIEYLEATSMIKYKINGLYKVWFTILEAINSSKIV
jgi:hypothetical protein